MPKKTLKEAVSDFLFYPEETTNTCEHIIGVHIGHSTYTQKEFNETLPKNKKARDNILSCCGGFMEFTFCPLCGEKIK